MTKEELEDKFDLCFDKHTEPTGGGYEADYTDRRGFYNDFEPIIFKYAKQESFKYFEFKKQYQLIEGMNVRHQQNKMGGIFSWVGASDEKIWKAYLKNELPKYYYEK